MALVQKRHPKQSIDQPKQCIASILLWVVANGVNAFTLKLPRLVIKFVPRAHVMLSVAMLYVYAQALGLLWVFLVSLAAVSFTRVVSAALGDESSQGGVAVLAAHPLRTITLFYVYYCVFRIITLFSNSMWIVSWELYHNFPTLRLMLTKRSAPRSSPEFSRQVSSGEETGDPTGASGQSGYEDAAAARRLPCKAPPGNPGIPPSTRRRVVLVVPLVLLALSNLVVLLGQAYCGGHDAGICRGSLLFDPLTRLNRMVRFVLFISQLQWVQAWMGMFPLWDAALWRRASGMAPSCSSSRLSVGAMPRDNEASKSNRPEGARVVIQSPRVRVPPKQPHVGGPAAASAKAEFAVLAQCLVWGLLLGLVPVTLLRLVVWLLQPAGVGVVHSFFGLKHYEFDTAMSTAWSVWMLCACFTIMTRSRLQSSGFSIRRVTDDDKWVKLCTTFKYTAIASGAVHFVRGCCSFGYAHAATDLIVLTALYPIVLSLVWIVTFIAMGMSRFLDQHWLTVGALGSLSLACLFGVAWLLCWWVDRSDMPFLISFVWLHLCRQLFRMLRKWGRKASTGWARRGRTDTMKFNLEPSKSKELSGSYFIERRFGRIAVTTLLLIGLCFASVLSGVIVMAAVQQKQGIFFKDVVNWRDVAGGIQVDNTRVSFLTLKKPCDTQRATCAANWTKDIQPVLPKTEFPHYAVCGHRWHGLSLVDYAFLSEMAYFERDSDMAGYLAAVLPQKQVTIQGVFEKPRKWFHLDVHHCPEGWPSHGNESQCKVLSVVAISGTDPTVILDYAENLRMWTEPVSLQILSTVFPSVRIWPRDTSAMVIASIHSVLEGLGLEDNQWHYQGILEYVRSLPESRDVVITGHSLGGGMALVIGALTNRLAVAIQPPGVYYSLAKHQFQQSSLAATSHLHQRSVSLVFEGDWVQHFDSHGGLVQTMMCDASKMNVQLGCHMLEGAICHLLRHCGDDADRFEGCRHDYTPQHTAADAIQSGFAAVQGGVASTFSNLRPSRDLNQFLIASLTVSVVVLTRNIGTSSGLYGSLGFPES